MNREDRRKLREKKQRLKAEIPRDEDFGDEKALEDFCCAYADRRGFCSLKLTSDATGEDSWPDRLFFGRSVHNHATVFLVEFKDFGRVAGPRQRLVHRIIDRKYGLRPYVIDRWSRFLIAWRRETGYSG